MQLLGIFINEGDKKVIKNLRTKTFYPFINLENFDYNNFSKQPNVKKRIEELKKIYKAEEDSDRKFTNIFYSLNDKQDIESKTHPAITLNCIVGKNGSGKSSLLNLEYRIINNLSCEIKNCLKKHNQGYNPVWAVGFNAELYYELNNDIYCIEIKNNYDPVKNEFFIKATKPEKGKAVLQTQNDGDVLFSNLSFENDSDEDSLLQRVSENFFYTVGTNYSIYSNSVVTDEWGEKEELWMRNIYHKNDGYFTPVVLVPYRNQWTTVDTKKELNLAKERLSTLSLLVYAQAEDDDKDFIEGLIPEKICYKLKEKDVYEKEIREKLFSIIPDEDSNYFSKNDWFAHATINNLQEHIRNEWENLLISNELISKQKTENIINNTIRENVLEYLSYKVIKMCLYYDTYRNYLLYEPSNKSELERKDEGNKNPSKKEILKVLKKHKDAIAKNNTQGDKTDLNAFYGKLDDIINILFTLYKERTVVIRNENQFEIDFTNLKVIQCLVFFDNANLYLNNKFNDSLFNKVEISVKELIKHIEGKKDYHGKENLSYDFIFQNLLPSYFNKDFYYTSKIKKTDNSDTDNGRTLASLSSGESQLLNALSYAVYHIKNAASSKIKYKNINLVFDEAELYYHPEYQRSFIKDLLGIIKRSNLSNVASISITIVTHSPFILSDIPDSNLLCLEKGERKKPFTKTLGANFYDLLQNQFFMESSIGSVVEDVMNKILDDYKNLRDTEKTLEDNKKEKLKSNDENKKQKIEKEINKKQTKLNKIKTELSDKYKKYLSDKNDFYNQFLEKLSDEYLQSTMRNLIGIMIEDDFFARRINELEGKKKRLEEELKKHEA